MTGGSQWKAIGFHKDRQGRRGGGVMFYVKENLDCTEVNYSDFGSLIECLWVHNKGSCLRGGSHRGICYQPPNQDDEAKEEIFGSLKLALGQWNLVLMGGFDKPDIWGKNSTVAHMSSIKFLE